MPLNFSYITCRQPWFIRNWSIVDIHRSLRPLFSLVISSRYSLQISSFARRIRNTMYAFSNASSRRTEREGERWRMLRFHDARTSRYAVDLTWTRYEAITCATLWTVLWFAVSRLNSNIGNSLALLVFVTRGGRMRAFTVDIHDGYIFERFHRDTVNRAKIPR